MYVLECPVHLACSQTLPAVSLSCTHCRRCVSAKVLDNIGSVDNLEGFIDLDDEDQARIRTAFEQGYVTECKEVEDKVRHALCRLGVRLHLATLQCGA
jgi:hypothetical protein